MHLNPYGGSAVELAAALVNRTDYQPVPLSEMLAIHEIRHPRLTGPQAGELASWAAAMSPVFGESSVDRQVELVNGLLGRAASQPWVSMHDGQPPHLHYTCEQSDVVSRVRAVTAGGLAAALCYGGGHRLGRCVRPGCGVVYVDTSRNGRRRYCGLQCSNRANVAAHRATRRVVHG